MLSVSEVRRELVLILPAFDAVLRDEGSPFADADREFAFHGLFAELSHYVREHVAEINEASRERLFDFVEHCTASDPRTDFGLSDAATTCFIENLTNDPAAATLRRYLGRESGAYFDAWDRGSDGA